MFREIICIMGTPCLLVLTFDLFHGTQSAGCVGRCPVFVAIAAVIGGQIRAQSIVQKGHCACHHGAGTFRRAHQVCHLSRAQWAQKAHTHTHTRKNTLAKMERSLNHLLRFEYFSQFAVLFWLEKFFAQLSNSIITHTHTHTRKHTQCALQKKLRPIWVYKQKMAKCWKAQAAVQVVSVSITKRKQQQQ